MLPARNLAPLVISFVCLDPALAMADATLDLAGAITVPALFHSVDPAMAHLPGSFALRTFRCAIVTVVALGHSIFSYRL